MTGLARDSGYGFVAAVDFFHREVAIDADVAALDGSESHLRANVAGFRIARKIFKRFVMRSLTPNLNFTSVAIGTGLKSHHFGRIANQALTKAIGGQQKHSANRERNRLNPEH